VITAVANNFIIIVFFVIILLTVKIPHGSRTAAGTWSVERPQRYISIVIDFVLTVNDGGF